MDTIHAKPLKLLVAGILILLCGIAFLLREFGFINPQIQEYLFKWQMILILVGIVNLFGRGFFFGLILIVMGGIFIIPGLIGSVNIFKLIIPMVLIAIGLSILFAKSPAIKINKHIIKENDYSIEEYAIFGGGQKKVTRKDFNGGSIIAIFGGVELDLTQAELAEGIHDLEVLCIFGGVSISVPSDWQIHTQVVSVLGGFADKRKGQGIAAPNRELIIKGYAILGGGEIKYV